MKMTFSEKNYLIKKYRFTLKFKVWAIFLCILMIYFFYGEIEYRQYEEPATKEKTTSTKGIHSLDWELNSLATYPILSRAFRQYKETKDYGTYVIPGLSASVALNNTKEDMCTSMTPQSICIACNYVLIGAYCHSRTHNSIIYVLDKVTHDLKKEILLDDKTHIGGLAYDNVNRIIWVAGHKKGIAMANGFSMNQLEAYNHEEDEKPISYCFEHPLYSIPRDSFMTYRGGYLYIGYFQRAGNSILEKFKIAGTGDLKLYSSDVYQQHYEKMLPDKIAMPINVFVVDSMIQGIAFYKNTMFLTKSYGILPSKLYTFDVVTGMNDNSVYTKDTALNSYSLPQKVEQIYISDGAIYTLYESGAYAYRLYSYPSVDRILKIPLDILTTSEHDEKK